MTTYIVSNRTDGSGYWHIGVRHESRSVKTSKLFGVYFKTRCAGKTLGGAYGYAKSAQLPQGAALCPACSRLGDKGTDVAEPLEARPVGEKPLAQTMVESWLGCDVCPDDVTELAAAGSWSLAARRLAEVFSAHAGALRDAAEEIV